MRRARAAQGEGLARQGDGVEEVGEVVVGARGRSPARAGRAARRRRAAPRPGPSAPPTRSLTTGRAAFAIARTGSRGKRTWPTSSATAPPMSASRARAGEGLEPGCSVATTRMPEIAAWLTRICPAPKSSAAAIESPTTSMRTRVLAPSQRTMTSATTMPTATPTTSSIARTVRPPRDTPIAMTAAAGAKNGCGCSRLARNHAAPAATVVWRIPHRSPRTRRTRRRSAPRTSCAVGMEGRAGTGWIVPARLPVRRLRHDGDAVARRGRDRIVGRQAQVRRQRVEVDVAAEAVGAVAQLGEAVAAVGQERVDRDAVGRRRIDRGRR